MSDDTVAKTILKRSKNEAAGVALVSAALLDEILRSLLLAAMPKISNTVAERIFGSYGPLYELAPKADIAHGLGFLSAEMLAVLRIVKDIRNTFAHSNRLLTFSSPEIVKLCQKFPASNSGADTAEIFEQTIRWCAIALDNEARRIRATSIPAP